MCMGVSKLIHLIYNTYLTFLPHLLFLLSTLLWFLLEQISKQNNFHTPINRVCQNNLKKLCKIFGSSNNMRTFAASNDTKSRS